MVIRQGDVLLIPSRNETGERLDHLTLALGEVTGHSHRILDGNATLINKSGTLYLSVESNSATLVHEEHKPISLEEGIYEVVRQREYNPIDNHLVQD